MVVVLVGSSVAIHLRFLVGGGGCWSARWWRLIALLVGAGVRVLSLVCHAGLGAVVTLSMMFPVDCFREVET